MSEQSNRNFRNHVAWPLLGAGLVGLSFKVASSPDYHPLEQNKGCATTPVEAGSDVTAAAVTDALWLNTPVTTDGSLHSAVSWAAATAKRIDGSTAAIQPGQPVETCIIYRPLNPLGTWAVGVTVFPPPHA